MCIQRITYNVKPSTCSFLDMKTNSLPGSIIVISVVLGNTERHIRGSAGVGPKGASEDMSQQRPGPDKSTRLKAFGKVATGAAAECISGSGKV